MWAKIAGIILRNRLPLIIAVIITTLFMGYNASKVEMSYEMAQLLPESDSTYIGYQNFKKIFGEDGSIVVIGIDNKNLFELENFNAWYDLTQQIKNIEVTIQNKNGKDTLVKGVTEALSIANAYILKKNKEKKVFEFENIIKSKPKNQKELDSLKNVLYNQPFYRGFLFSDSSSATVIIVTLNRTVLDSKFRVDLFKKIDACVESFEQTTGFNIYESGLPLIRANSTSKVAKEIKLFLILALLVLTLILYAFFRSFKAIFFSLIVVGIGVIWSLGILSLFNYKITILTGLIPPLILVIGIPNCIFLLNKYHQEFKKHGNQIKALNVVIRKTGNAIFLTNTTTALGFATFIFTQSKILVEFGTVASIDIFAVFIISILLIPIIFSFLPPPKERHTKHLENELMLKVVQLLERLVVNHRKGVYFSTVLLLIFAFWGISKMTTTGNIVDDLPKHDKIVQDLKFFEKEFKGVMPFEIMIDTKEKNGVFNDNAKTLYKIRKLEKVISRYKEFSKPLSIVDAIQFAYQSYKNGNPKFYILPPVNELNKLKRYLPKENNTSDFKSFIDSTSRYTRINIQMADIGTKEMDLLLKDFTPKIDSIFSPEKYKITLTGTSVAFLKGTNYLVKNLFTSLALAVLLIAFTMSILFKSIRMVLISLIPNFIPLLTTAGLMGWFGIPIKPSTILVFSIAFGISVDDTIHYLAKYRQELKTHRWNIKEASILALRETGISMIYTSIVLFFGFGVFTASNFGGTVALGVLVSLTLLVAMISNLVVLPSLLLSLEKRFTKDAFKNELLLQIIDEEEDINLEKLQIKKIKTEE